MTAATFDAAFDAVVLAGGTSRRMGGGDKTSLEIGGVSLLERAVGAVAAADQIVVVGTARPLGRPVTWTVEDPVGGGPAAAVAAGLGLVTGRVVAVLAGDLPFVTAETVQRLVALAEPSGAVMVDGDGKPQWLLGAWPAGLLRGALAGDQSGASLRKALAPLEPALLASGRPRPEWFDCDEPADLSVARKLLDGREL